MQIEDEDAIPKKPEHILEKPNDHKYEKQIKELKDKITHHKESIVEYKEKIKMEKVGNNPEIKVLRGEKDVLNEKFDTHKKELDELKKTCDGVSSQVKALREIRASLETELDCKNMDQFTDELRNIQKKLGYGTMNAVEETKLIAKRGKLELQKPKIIKLNEASKKIKELNTKFGPQLKQIGEMVKKNKGLYEQKKEISTKLKALYDARQSNDPAIKVLQDMVESVKTNIGELKEEITKINAEWDDKWYKYEDQAALLDYIKRATDHVNDLKKRKAKAAKNLARMEKKAKEEGQTGDDEDYTPKKKEYFSYELGQCEWLLKYFRSLNGEQPKAETASITLVCGNSKLDEDLKKGGLTLMAKNTDGVDMSKGFNKKKGKKEKKENKKAAGILQLDIALITKVKDLGLTPPMNSDDVNAFIGELEGKLKFFEAEAVKKTEEMAEIAKANAEKAAEVPVEAEAQAEQE
jgi:chromosome segregation ATPase